MLEFGPTWRLADIRGMTERADDDVIECQALDGARQRLFCRSCRMDRTKIIVLERLKFLDFLAALPIKEKIINLIGEWLRPWLSQNEPLDSGLDLFRSRNKSL